MKQYILLTSLGAAGIATMLGVCAVLGQGSGFNGNIDAAVESIISTTKLYQLAGISGLFSISAFFVGLAYPSVTSVGTTDGGVVTKIAV